MQVSLYDVNLKSNIVTAGTIDEAAAKLWEYADSLHVPLPTGRSLGDHIIYEFNTNTFILSPATEAEKEFAATAEPEITIL